MVIAPLDLPAACTHVLTEPLVRRVAEHLGEPASAVRAALGVLVPSTLGLLAGHAGDAAFARRLYVRATDGSFATVCTQGVDRLVEDVFHPGTAMAGITSRARAATYGEYTSAVAMGIARTSGVSVVAGRPLVDVAVALSLWLLHDAIETHALDADGFTRWLVGQAPPLAALTPGWLLEAMAPRPGVRVAPSEVALGTSEPSARVAPMLVFTAVIIGAIVFISLLQRGG